jgi:hypothetical protein
VTRPTLALVDEVDARLGAFAPEFVGDRRRSPFRIHRDVRFSKDKRPYKTNAGCWFFHRDVRDGAPKDAGGGTGVAAAVHGGAGFTSTWSRARRSVPAGCGCRRAPRSRWCATASRSAPRAAGAGGGARVRAALRRALARGDAGTHPRGYAADDATAEWLRYQSYSASQPLADDAVTAPDLADRSPRRTGRCSRSRAG